MNTIDKLGAVNQAIAELEATARKLKAELIAKGVGVYNGELFTAEVQHYDRATINPRLVREVIDPELVSAVTEIKGVDAVVVRKL
jgi:tRNA A-37 threonylcarbamoyl transferase component Bud32